MGMYSLVEDARAQELAAAVEAANEWQKVGRPIIRASLKVLAASDEITPLFEQRRRDYQEANDAIEAAQTTLLEMLDGIRDDFLCDQRKTGIYRSDGSHDDAELEAADAFNDELQEAVLSVRDLEKIVEREDYEAYIRGDRR